ncbi:MAG: phosphoglycerate dehydrogenase [Bdellovibrionales bacterium]
MSQALKILLLEGIHPYAKTRLEEAGFHVEAEKGALGEADLIQRLPQFDALGIRSKTQLTPKILEANRALRAVGAFCIGTNQIDLNAANLLGTPVFNAPYSNTRSVAELVIGEMIALSRYMADVSQSAHAGGWLKSAKGAHEVRGKTLGIIGYGHIGSQLSVLAESMGLRVLYYDIVKKLPLGNAKPTESLAELLKESDFVSLHVPETRQTMNMISSSQIKVMKPGSYLINASRGTVVDISALAQALKQGHLGGAAVDVFPDEPENNDQKFKSELQGLKNVILTPHIGGSTEEAQEAIGLEVAESLIRVLKLGSTLGAVNFPQVDCPPVAGTHRLVNVHRNVPGVLGEINGIMSRAKANIRAQFLSTDNQIGYLVMDIEQADDERLAREVAALSTSIQTHIL